MDGGRLGGGGIERKGKRTHEHGQQCGDCGGYKGTEMVMEKIKLITFLKKGPAWFVTWKQI